MTTERIEELFSAKRPLVCVQGLGFVGLAMATVVANTFQDNNNSDPIYNVIGIELPSQKSRIDLINQGKLPFESEDQQFAPELINATLNNKNFVATSSNDYYQHAAIVVIDIPFNVVKNGKKTEDYIVEDSKFNQAIKLIATKIQPDCVVLVETTVPPGYCNKIIYPLMKAEFEKRNIKSDPLLAHSYERVMPGKQYLSSIRNFHRTYSGANEHAAVLAKQFLIHIVSKNGDLLRREQLTSESELAKVMENTYRATNIALIYEWTLLAEKMGVDLFSVIQGIKNRETHKNIMFPGLGVGGYCLTKDMLLGDWSAKNLYNSTFGLPLSLQSLAINDAMPLHVIDLLKEKLNTQKIKDKKIALLGISYRQDVGDTRFSPSETLFRALEEEGAQIHCHDPYVSQWVEVPHANIFSNLMMIKEMDIVIFCTSHLMYKNLSLEKLLSLTAPNTIIIDANNVIADVHLFELHKQQRIVAGIGKGHVNKI